MQILIVEDNPTNCQLMERFLSVCGRCTVVHDGQTAVEMFRMALDAGAEYRLVCLDVMMPKMDGHEVLSALRALEQERGIPDEKRSCILMTTAVDSPASMQDAKGGGSDGYLVKPIRKHDLYEELERQGLLPSGVLENPGL